MLGERKDLAKVLKRLEIAESTPLPNTFEKNPLFSMGEVDG